ncbi:MAG: serine hydrolase domain-containing protein [Galactobacter sp.]|uniref:serine hydrolase domain-containing protein n=1 Tax=Galactobacter sp. TaxID=2676125 RepID=UPI0025BC16B7|nr:serine hydrolase domain-containing protein [Galactobacter sp.]
MTGSPSEHDPQLSGAAGAAFDIALTPEVARSAPACLAAVTHRGRVVAVRALGEPRRDGQATTRDTVFRIASMSKSFLAATVMSLVDEGALDLGSPASAYVPGLAGAALPGPTAEGFDATLGELLANRGGLGEDNPFGDDHLGESRAWATTLVDSGLNLSSHSGTEYEYSNLGISVLGRAVEAVTGHPVEEVVAERILTPLGLTGTHAYAEDYPDAADLATGWRTFDGGESFMSEPYVGTGALGCIGSLFSTVDDIATWMHFLGSAFDEAADRDPAFESVLPAAARRRMQTGHTLMPTDGYQLGGRTLDAAGYGYGLVVELDHRFGRVVQHAGGLPGFSSHMRWHPTTGIGVVVFGNSDEFSGSAVAGQILTHVLEAVDAPSGRIRPWAATVDAAQRLDTELRAGALLEPDGWEALTDLFTRNVLRNVPADVRAQRLRTMVQRLGDVSEAGQLHTRVTAAPTPGTLRWVIPCGHGTLVAQVRMVGTPQGARVQAVSLAAAGPDAVRADGDVEGVQEHMQIIWE